MQYQNYRKIQFCIQLYIDIWEIILYLQANPYLLKNKNINSLIFISTIIKYVMLMIFSFDSVDFLQKEKRTACCILASS